MQTLPKPATKRKPKTSKPDAAAPACFMNAEFLQQIETGMLGGPGWVCVPAKVTARHMAFVVELTQPASLLGKRIRHCDKETQRRIARDDWFRQMLTMFANGFDPSGTMDATTLRGLLETVAVAWLFGFSTRESARRLQAVQQTKPATDARRAVNAERDGRIRERFEAECSKGRKKTFAYGHIAREFRISADTVRRACRRKPD